MSLIVGSRVLTCENNLQEIMAYKYLASLKFEI